MTGRPLREEELALIVKLLRETEMPMRAIAARMRCAPSTVAEINAKFKVRAYNGNRTSWSVS